MSASYQVVDAEFSALARFQRKRRAFLEAYDLTDRPVLILQAQLVEERAEMDVGRVDVRVALAQGGGNASDSPWSGLVSSSSALRGTVDGLACRSGGSPEPWASELHTDGHVIAGVWDLVQPFAPNDGECIAWWHADLIEDFGRLVVNLANKLDRATAEWMVTGAVLHADRLHYGSKANRHSNLRSPPQRRRHLEFRVRWCSANEGIGSAMQRMLMDFKRAYGEPS